MDLAKIRLGNGAGTIKTLEQVERACRSAMTDITVGSITMEERPGNTGDVYYFHPTELWSLNSLGIPNPGLATYRQLLPEMQKRAHDAGKKLRASVAGFSPEEYGILAQQCLECGADEVELNLGCPNVWGEGGQKPIASYHPELTDAILEKVGQAILPMKVAIKISPVEDPAALKKLTDVISGHPFISCIVATNTIPNQERLREDGKSALSFNGGNHLGGLAGKPLSPLVHHLLVGGWNGLFPNIRTIVAGGIFSGADVLEYLSLRSDISGFQCATAYLEYGPRIFSDILEEMSVLV